MTQHPEKERSSTAEQMAATSVGIDVQDEGRAFRAWWSATCPHLPVPGPASHLFGAWLASARRRRSA